MATTAIGIQAKGRLDELYRAHAADVYRYVYAVVGNRADAEDVTQTTFMNALRALERGELPRKPENWLITIAHNLIRQRFRQQYLRPRHVELDSELPTLEADDNGPSLDDLVRALQRIPPTQREALVLRELEGRSYKEIASILDVSRAALEGLIFRARRSLAEELENLVTCDRAELALSQQSDGRLGRKERRRLAAHLAECKSCARVAALALKRRRAFKGLALLPLPFSLTLFKGAPSASAAVGLPTIGASAAAGGGAAAGTGLAAKLAVGAAAVAVAGGAGYEGVKVVRDPATPVRPATLPAHVAPATAPTIRRVAPAVAATAPARAKPVVAKPKPVATKPKPAAAKPKPAATKPKPAAAKPKPVAAKPKPVAPTWNPVVKKAKLERITPAKTAPPPRSPGAAKRVKPVRAAAPAKDRGAKAPGRQTKPVKEQRVKPTQGKSAAVPAPVREKETKPR